MLVNLSAQMVHSFYFVAPQMSALTSQFWLC
jgi:hypothetical protein